MHKKWVRGALFASAAAFLATALHLGSTLAARAAEPYKAPRTSGRYRSYDRPFREPRTLLSLRR
jgi:hypothetical protein